MWYAFYAISAPSRSLSLAGAVPLIIGGFVLPEANGISQALCWLAWPPASDAASKQRSCWRPCASQAAPPIRLALLQPRLLLQSRTCRKALYLPMLPIDFNGLDSAIHGPVRLGIMTACKWMAHWTSPPSSSAWLCLTAASICTSRHWKKTPTFAAQSHRRVAARTTYNMTSTGRKALAAYVQSMRAVIGALEQSE